MRFLRFLRFLCFLLLLLRYLEKERLLLLAVAILREWPPASQPLFEGSVKREVSTYELRNTRFVRDIC